MGLNALLVYQRFFFFFFFFAALAAAGDPAPPGEVCPGADSGERTAALCGEENAARPDRWLAAAF